LARNPLDDYQCGVGGMDSVDYTNHKGFMKKKSKRGGKREGSGRKKKEETVVIRVRKSKLEEVKKVNSKP